jgi:TonB-linked SusC/RagA family outer membrane protein
MKYTLFLLITTISIVSATTLSQTKVSLNLKNATVKEALHEIQRQTDYSFLYSNVELNDNSRVSIKCKNEPLDNVLAIILKDKGVSFSVDATFISIFKNAALLVEPSAPSGTMQQKRLITGTVTDAVTGEPLVGASIREKGTENGNITDADGNFTLSVSDNAILQVSFVGYKSLEISAIDGGGGKSLNIKMLENVQALSDVVVIGYGMQKKVNLTGSVATIKTEDIQSAPVSNLANALAGRLSGVYVSAGSGGRPGNSSTVSIRAKGTWNNASPLYVIDGIVRDQFAFDGIDANDLENISVLKDAASASIYGSRAANGVILVTTKKGKSGKPVITYNGTIGTSDETMTPKVQTAYERAKFNNDALLMQGLDATNAQWFTDDELEYYKTHTYNWIDDVSRNPVLSHHSLNVSGGNDVVRYYIGGNYFYETGPFINMKYDRNSLRSNVDVNLTKNLVVGLSLYADNRNDDKPYWKNDAGRDGLDDMWGSFLVLALPFHPWNLDGKAIRVENNYIAASANMAAIVSREETYHRKKYTNYESSFWAKYDLPAVPGLSFKFLYNDYSRQTFYKQFVYPFDVYYIKSRGEHHHIPVMEFVDSGDKVSYSTNNILNERYDRDHSYQLNGFINFDRTFGLHEISAVAIYEQAEGTNDWFWAQLQNFRDASIDQIPAGDKNYDDIDGSASEDGRLSYAGRIHYGYDNKYLLELSARYDGSVKFSPGHRWGFFPSGSAAWRVSEENFFKDNVKFIDYLKLRGSIGLLGNDAVGGWQWMSTYSYQSGAQYGNAAQGMSPGVIVNPLITWEKSLNYEGGLDITFLQNRLSASYNMYYKHTYDILGSRVNVLPSTFGGNMPNENYGVVDSRGYELELGYTDKIGKDFTWHINGNITYATNKYVTLDEAENIRPYQSKKGLNLDRAMGWIYTGLVTQADLDRWKSLYPDANSASGTSYRINGKEPLLGMLNFKDIRGANSDEPDGVIDGNDEEWIAKHTLPPVTYGISLGAEWKGISLEIFLQGMEGHQAFMGRYGQEFATTSLSKNNFAFWNDHWMPDNPNATMPRIMEGYTWNAYPSDNNQTTFWMRDAGFLRLKNINLAYKFPNSILKSLHVSQASVFLTATNVCLLVNKLKDFGFDPELAIEDGVNAGNGNIVRYPPTKNISLGLNLSF